MRALALALLALLVCVPVASAQGTPSPVVIAGTGESAEETGDRGDGGPATDAAFIRVDGLDWAGDGSILVADSDDQRIRIIQPNGNIQSSSADIGEPLGVFSAGWAPNDVFFEHNMIVADADDDQVESWTLLATGDWSDRVAMEDTQASDVEDASNGLWVADPDNGTVWHVTFNSFLNSFDASPALEGLDDPRGVGALPVSGFLVATRGGDCVIRRRANGVTQVVAGREGECLAAEFGPEGNGGPATAARLNQPTDVEATPDGGFVFLEEYRLRRVAPDGTLSSLYATGIWTNPDFPPPAITALDVTPDGDVLIARGLQVLRFDTNYAPAANPTPTPTPTPNPQPPPPPGPDTTTPGLALGGKKSQKAGKSVSVVVSATTEDLYASASGTVSVPGASKVYRLKSIANRFVARGTKATLKLKVPKAALKAIRRALRGRKTVKARIKLAARDGAGNLTTGRRTVKLTR